jgi:hypothetical protein
MTVLIEKDDGEMWTHPGLEDALNEVARDTGRPLHIVERVFHLMMEVDRYNALLIMIEGRLTAVNGPANYDQLPPSLHAEINESYDEIVELLDSTMRACRWAATGMAE